MDKCRGQIFDDSLYAKLRNRINACLISSEGIEPICVDVLMREVGLLVKDVGTLGEQGIDDPFIGSSHLSVDEATNINKTKKRKAGKDWIDRTDRVATEEHRGRQKGEKFEFEKLEWKPAIVWRLIQVVQCSIRDLEIMQRNAGSANLGCCVAVRGDEQYCVPKTKVVAVYLDNSCLYQLVCASITAMGYAFVPLHRQWSSNVMSEVLEACGAMTVFWSENHDTRYATAKRGVPGGLGRPPCWRRGEDQNSLGQLWCSELKFSDASEELNLCVEHTCQGEREEVAGSKRMQHAGGCLTHPELSTAYIMRTSGTTKIPGGQSRYVLGTMRGILNRIEWFESEYPSQAGTQAAQRDVLGFSTPNCFVDHVWQMFAPLCSNIQTVAFPFGVYMDDKLLLKAIKQFRITHLVLTPSKWQRLVKARCSVHDAFGCIKVAISSGELLTSNLLGQLRKVLHPKCKILNIYGSTEVSADASWYECSNFCALDKHPYGGNMWVPAGKPIQNTTVALSMHGVTDDRLEDRDMQSISYSGKQVGMIWCGGVGISNGYLDLSNNTDRQQQGSRFAIFRDFNELKARFDYILKGNLCPLGQGTQIQEESSIWMFCTGDLGFIDDDGDLVVIGRADPSSKVGGQFLQIEAIEHFLESIQGIVKAFATIVEIEGQKVVAACTVQDGSNLSESQIQFMCRQKGDVMSYIPQHIFEVGDLPLTYSGKLDRHLLQEMVTAMVMEKIERRTRLNLVVPEDAILTEREIYAIVADCLHIVAFEPTENIFDLGANSVAVQKIASILNLSPNQVIDHPTVRRLTKVRNRVLQPNASGHVNGQKHSPVKLNRNEKIPLLWKFVSDSCIDLPPCVSMSTVFCCSHTGLVAALKMEDGHVLWTRALNCTLTGKIVASGSMLVVPGEPEVACLNALNGNILWKKIGIHVASRSGAYFDEHENIWICTHNLGLVVLSAKSGEIVATHSVDGPISSSIHPSGITLSDGRKMCFAATLNSYAVGLMYHYESQTKKPEIVTTWTHSLPDPVFATPVLLDSSRIVYLSVKGAVHCLDAVSGQVLFRSNEVANGHHYFISPIPLLNIQSKIGAYILLASQQGKLTVLDMHNHHLQIKSAPVVQFSSTLLQIASVADPSKGSRNTILCTLDSGELCSLHLVLRDKEWKAQDCRVLHSFDSTQSHALCTDCNGHIFAGTRDDTLYAFSYSLPR